MESIIVSVITGGLALKRKKKLILSGMDMIV